MKKSVRPGFSAITTWPRYGTTAGSGTRSCAPIPAQFTITGAAVPAAASASDATVPIRSSPPAWRNRASR